MDVGCQSTSFADYVAYKRACHICCCLGRPGGKDGVPEFLEGELGKLKERSFGFDEENRLRAGDRLRQLRSISNYWIWGIVALDVNSKGRALVRLAVGVDEACILFDDSVDSSESETGPFPTCLVLKSGSRA